MMATRIFAAAFVTIALESCVSIQKEEYPRDWAPLFVDGGDCPELTGNYANEGSKTSVLLAKWILPKTTAPLDKIARVRFDGPQSGGLSVRLIEASGRDALERKWNEGVEYHCENGWIVVSLESALIPPLPFGYFKSARFARTVDHQLVIEATETAFGISPYALVVPEARQVGKWYLYPLAVE